MNKENRDFSLYHVFGQFMGPIKIDPTLPLKKRLKIVEDIRNKIIEKAEDHGLKANFISTGKRPDDFNSKCPITEKRLNIISPEGRPQIIEISLG